MPLTLTTTPTTGSGLASDTSPLTLTLQTVGSPSWNNPFWEVNDGVLSNPFAENPTYTFTNRSEAITLLGTRVAYMQGNWSTLTAFSQTAPYGSLTKNGGTNTAWDAIATSTGVIVGMYDGFFAFSTSENNKEKAAGLSDNVTSATPTASTFKYNWHLMSDGTCMPRKAGVALLTTAIAYSANDSFKIGRVGTTVTYYKNEVVIATLKLETVVSLAPLVGAKTSSSTINNTVLYNANSSSQGSLTFNVFGVFPAQPNYTYELNPETKTLTSYAEDGTAVFRKKGGIKRGLSLQFINRPYTEYVVINDFWEWHQKHLSFLYRDVVFGKVYTVVFNAGIRTQVVGPDQITITISLQEI